MLASLTALVAGSIALIAVTKPQASGTWPIGFEPSETAATQRRGRIGIEACDCNTLQPPPLISFALLTIRRVLCI